MTPNDIDFLMKIKRMRYYQSAYFKSKNSMYLSEAKELERVVDNQLKVLFQELNITGDFTLSYDEVMKQQKEKFKQDQLKLEM